MRTATLNQIELKALHKFVDRQLPRTIEGSTIAHGSWRRHREKPQGPYAALHVVAQMERAQRRREAGLTKSQAESQEEVSAALDKERIAAFVELYAKVAAAREAFSQPEVGAYVEVEFSDAARAVLGEEFSAMVKDLGSRRSTPEVHGGVPGGLFLTIVLEGIVGRGVAFELRAGAA